MFLGNFGLCERVCVVWCGGFDLAAFLSSWFQEVPLDAPSVQCLFTLFSFSFYFQLDHHFLFISCRDCFFIIRIYWN